MKSNDLWDRRLLDRQLAKLQAQERQLLRQGRAGDWEGRLLEKLPDNIRQTLHMAVEKAFVLVLEHAAGIIERTLEKQNCHLAEQETVRLRRLEKSELRQLERKVRSLSVQGLTFTAAESTALGLLGIGLPEIPIFLAALMRTIYGVGMFYGFSHHTRGERCFILSLLCTAAAREDSEIHSACTDRIGYAIDHGETCNEQEASLVAAAAQLLTDRLLFCKAVQGIALVGAVGGIWSTGLLHRTGKMAEIKYKKRYLYLYADRHQQKP